MSPRFRPRGGRRAAAGPRRALALALALWPPGATLSLLAVACSASDAEPTAVARAYVDAVRRGDTRRLLDLADEDSRGRLQRAAEQASDQVGGRRTVEAHELLQIVDVDPTLMIKHYRVTTLTDDQAVVELEATDGRTTAIVLVRNAGAWRVRLPTPPDPDAASSAPPHEVAGLPAGGEESAPRVEPPVTP